MRCSPVRGVVNPNEIDGHTHDEVFRHFIGNCARVLLRNSAGVPAVEASSDVRPINLGLLNTNGVLLRARRYSTMGALRSTSGRRGCGRNLRGFRRRGCRTCCHLRRNRPAASDALR